MKTLILFLGLLALISGCDPAGRAARVRPDKSVEAFGYDNEKLIADVYLSKDKLVELQIFGSSAMGTPAIHANVVNNRSQPIRLDLKNATYNVSYSPKRLHLKSVYYDGCKIRDEFDSHGCEPTEITINGKATLRLTLDRAAQGEFHLPIYSEGQPDDEIVARFERCGVIGKCETIH